MASGKGGTRTWTKLSATDGAYCRRAPSAAALDGASDDEAAERWSGGGATAADGGEAEDGGPSSRLLSQSKETSGKGAEPRSAAAVADWDAGVPVTSKTVVELLLCILAFVGRGLCLNSLGPTLIDLRQLTRVPVEDSATIFVSQSAGLFLGSLAAKSIFDRVNQELAMALALFGQALSTAAVPLTPLLAVMCVAFGCQGFFIGVVGIGVTTLCLKLGGQKRNGMYLQAVYLGVSVGSIVGPFMAKPFLSVEALRQGSSKMTDLLLATVAPPGNHVRGSSSVEGSRVAWPVRKLLLATATDSLLASAATTAGPSASSVTARSSSFGPIFNISTPELVTAAPSMASTVQFNGSEQGLSYTATNVLYDYVLMAAILALPSIGFLLLYAWKDRAGAAISSAPPAAAGRESCCGGGGGGCRPPSVRLCSPAPVMFFFVLLFLQCLVFFGMQDSYSNLLTTFVVLSDLRLPKVRGVYATSTFWAAICFGRLNGIWLARLVSPFKMLLVDTALAVAAAIALLSFGQRSEYVLWVFSAVLGISFATVNAATVSWAASRVDSSGYLLTIIMVGRCSGLLTIPTVVSAVFRVAGAMSLMRALMVVTAAHLLCLVAAELIAKRCGVNGRLHGKQTAADAGSAT